MREGVFFGPCGSRWHELGEIETGAACLVIEHLRDLLAEKDFRIAELEALLAGAGVEVAA